MNKTAKRMADNMSAMLATSGYVASFKFTQDAIVATVPTMARGATVTLTFHPNITPGEAVFEIQRLLDKLNS